MIHDGGHPAKECFSLKAFATAAMKVAPSRPPKHKDNNKKEGDKGAEDEFQEADKEVGCIFGGPDAYASKHRQKLALREVNAVAPATLEYLRWSEVPITFDRSDHPDHVPRPGKHPLVLAPSVSKVRLKKTFIDGGSCLDILFAKTLPELRLTVEDLEPSSSPFHGIILGRSTYPFGQITLPVTFGTRENFRTECVVFQVADINSAYHAILGRPAISKFMAVPHYPCLMMKMPGPKGVITLRTDVKTAYECDVHSCELADKGEAQEMREDIRKMAAALQGAEDEPLEASPTKNRLKRR